MCTIDRMLIKGIRSFSPNNQDVVVFYKPLTLIVGANGAGKTTIIECLKQACTGELPPNTRSGQSFIHDPKVAHETEVKAQIKLRFNITGQRVTVLRSFQLSQKKTTLQFKTLDSTIMMENTVTGENKAVTYKCVDMDKMVPQLMGVPKAVLEYVIFVHQEDSNWPLAEGKVLKERFDDIFAATKYTKALETLRKLRTEKSQQVKELKLKFEVLRNQRNTAQMHQEQLANAEHEHAMAVEQSKQLEADVQKEAAKVEQLQRAKEELNKLGQEIQMCLVRVEEFGKQAASKRAQLEGFDVQDTTEQLAATLQKFDATIDNTRIRAARLKGEIQTKNMQVQAVRNNLNKEMQRHSRLQAERSVYDQRVRERDEFIRSTAASLHLPLPGAEGLPPEAVLPSTSVSSFQAALRQHVADSDAALAQAKETNRQRDAQLSSAVDKLTTSLTQQQEQLRIKSQQISHNTSTAQGLKAQADAMIGNEGSAVEAQRRVDRAEDDVRAKNEELAKQDLDSKLAKEKRDIDDLASTISSLRQERDRIAGASEAATRLRVKQQELTEKKEQLVTLLHARKTTLLQLLGAADLPPVEQLKSSCDNALARKNEQHKQQLLELRQHQAAESQARAQLTAARDALAAHDQQRTQLLTQLRARVPATAELPVVWEPGHAVGNERLLEKALNDPKMALETAKEKLTTQEAMKKYLNRLRKMMCEEKSCPACYRGFASDQELQHSLTQLDEGVREQPRRLEQLQQQVATVQAAHDGLLALQPSWRKLLDMEAHAIPDTQAKIRPLEESLTSATVAASSMSEAVSEGQKALADATQLVAEAVWQIDRQAKEVTALQGEVEAAALGTQSGGVAGRTLAEVDGEIDDFELERSTKEAARESMLKRQKRLNDELVNLMRNLTAAKDALTAHKARMQKKQELLQKAAELEASNTQLEAELVTVRASVAPLEAERGQAVQRRDQMRNNMRADEERLEAALRTARQLLDSYHQRVTPVQQYEAAQQGAELARAEASVTEARSSLARLEEEIGGKEREEQQATEELAQQESYRHKLQDVLELRAVEQKLTEQEQKVTQLQAKQREVGKEADINAQLRVAMNDKELLQKQLDMLEGSSITQQQIINREKAALRQPEYKDIVPRYNKAYAEFTYTELAVGDLDKYHKALEKALLSFHTTKMADINKIIKELWQKTYRGQDIDYIQIKADADGQRSYNYRVVMYCAGAELDMRGRCSAGQKVLACLIIRLALAETFCLNCGILALDEPTTNLDADNSASLAEALRAVMLARREQENFQLIVITHDEKFAHQIGTREQAETLWRITKNDSGHTHIARELID